MEIECKGGHKALVMGGLNPKFAEGIRMPKPRSLKKVINLARMLDDQLSRCQKIIEPSSMNPNQSDWIHSSRKTISTPMKRLTWDEMQINRSKWL